MSPALACGFLPTAPLWKSSSRIFTAEPPGKPGKEYIPKYVFYLFVYIFKVAPGQSPI